MNNKVKMHFKSIFRTVGIISFLSCVLVVEIPAQSAKKVEKTVNRRQEQLDKQKEGKAEQQKKEMETLKKKHYEMQTKDVQKRMKKSRKTAERNNRNKKGFFLTRWFGKR